MIDTTSLWPTDQGRANYQWGAVAGRLGYYPLVRPILLAIRGVERYAPKSHPLVHQPVYDDTFVFLALGEAPVVMVGATHAYQRDSKASPPGPDGRGAVGSIRPGRYLLNDLNNGAEVIFHITNPDGSDRLPAWRDFDHDGRLSPEEMQRSENIRTGVQVGNSGTWADSILLHGGLEEPPARDGTPAKHKFSIGCFTTLRQYRQLISMKCRPYSGKCDLVLLKVEELVEIVAGLDTYSDDKGVA